MFDGSQKIAEVKNAINTAEWAIEGYVNDLGGDKELVLTPPSEILNMFRTGKIHGFCNKCGNIVMNPSEFIAHNNMCGVIVSWFKN